MTETIAAPRQTDRETPPDPARHEPAQQAQREPARHEDAGDLAREAISPSGRLPLDLVLRALI